MPHEIQITLRESSVLRGFRYLPRQDGTSNGRIGRYEFYVSADGINWGAPVATGTFVNDATEKQVLFAAKAGRHVRLRALSEVSGRAFTSLAELRIIAPAIGRSICLEPVARRGWAR